MDAENGRWWVVRKSTDTFGLTDTTFQAKVLNDARVSSNYINSLLSTLQKEGTDEDFKTLYKFDDEAFDETRANGKKIMMIIGTSKSLEDQYPVTDYVRFMVATMSDEYDFYYKGHPGNYMANSAENVAKYESMGIKMLEPSIAAELFIFYNDDLYLCGYESSLYLNASNDKSEEQDVALFRRTLETAKADPNLKGYADYMDFTISDLTNNKDNFTYAYDSEWDNARPGMTAAKEKANYIREKALEVIPEAEKNDKNYLVEYNNNGLKTVSDYDYAIWNSTQGIVHYLNAEKNLKLEIAETSDVSNKLTDNNTVVEGLKAKTYTGKKITQSIVVTTDGKTLKKGTDYSVTYSNNKNVGSATVTIKGKGNYRGTVVKGFNINPKGTTIKKVKKGSASFTVKWKKQSKKMSNKRITGYQIQYSTDSTMNNAQTNFIKGYKKTSLKVSGLEKKQKYYVQVRTYRNTNNGSTYYSSWSKVKSVTTK